MNNAYIEELEALSEELKNGNVLLLGAPSIGKTYELFEVFKKDKEALFIFDQKVSNEKEEEIKAKIFSAGELDKKENLANYKRIIIDDCYKVFCILKERGLLSKILEIKTGVCLATTLYRGEKVLRKFNLTNFKPIFYKVDKTKAKKKIMEYLHQKIGEEVINKVINKIVKHSEWSYPLDKEIWSIEEKKYSTYVPYYFVDALIEFGENGLKLLTTEFLQEISVSGIDASLHAIAEEIKESDAGEVTKKFYEELMPMLTVSIPVIFYGISAGFLVGAFTILRKIIGMRQEKVEEFRPFASLLQMRPQDIETLEKKLGCPPLTLFTIRELMKPRNLHKLHNVAEKTRELKKEFEDLEKRFTKDLQKLDELETKWKENENKLTEARETTLCFNEINKTISYSIKDPSLCFDTLEPLKKQGIIPKDANIKIIERDEIAADIIKEIDAGKKLILIKGKGGIGKSSLMTFLAEKLKERGFFVGVPDTNKSKSFIELKVEQEKHRMGGSILLSEYGMKQKGNIIAGLEDSDLGFIINLLLTEKCTAVIMECRSEYNLAFKTALNKIRGLDIPRYEIELHGVERMEDVVNQIFNTPEVIGQLEEIRRVSRIYDSYNPLIAILAASWVDRGENLKGLSTNKFLEEFVDELFYKDKTQEVQKIFTLLSLCGVIRKEDLKKSTKMWASPADDLSTKWDKIESVMESYSDGNYYAITPDLISEIIFSNKTLKFFAKNLDDMLANFEYEDFDYYCLMVALNLGQAYQKGIDCIAQTYILLERIRKYPHLYAGCIHLLIFKGGLPMEFMDISEDEVGLLTEVGVMEFTEVFMESEGVKLDHVTFVEKFLFSSLAYNYVAAGKCPNELLRSVDSLLHQVTEILIKKNYESGKNFNVEEFKKNCYTAISFTCLIGVQLLIIDNNVLAEQQMEQYREIIEGRLLKKDWKDDFGETVDSQL